MSGETRARRAVGIYSALCLLSIVPLVVTRTEAAASWALIISVLALPWTRVAGVVIDRFGLPPWSLVPMLGAGVVINALLLYWLVGGRFRTPDV